jgi:hypothetical protein
MPDNKDEPKKDAAPASTGKASATILKPSPLAVKVQDSFTENPPPDIETAEEIAIQDFTQAYDKSLEYQDVTVPKGAYIEDPTAALKANASIGRSRIAPAFSDEFAGQGGRYVINPETGERQPVYERYIAADGEKKVRKAA